MKYIFTALCASSLLFFSCSNQTESEKADALTADSVENDAANQPHSTETTTPPASEGMQPSTPQNNSSSQTGMNPAHGAPGHRCEIAVGAPLSSVPSAVATPPAAAPATTFSPPPASAPVNTPPAATAPGMNPPHGQPGHDCAIAVGAPLKK